MLGLRKFIVAMYALTLEGFLIGIDKVDGAIGIPVMAGTAAAYITLEVVKKKLLDGNENGTK